MNLSGQNLSDENFLKLEPKIERS